MGDDDYVKELKQGAVGMKLPTMLDLNPADSVVFTDSIEAVPSGKKPGLAKRSGRDPYEGKTPEVVFSEIYALIRELRGRGKSTEQIYRELDSKGYSYELVKPVLVEMPDNPVTEVKKPAPAKAPEQIASEIYAIISDLHGRGRSLEEIYDALESKGYRYDAIEPVFIEYLNKSKMAAKAPAQAPPVFKVAPQTTKAQMPVQQITSPVVNIMQQPPAKPPGNIEIVELHQVAPAASEEIPTTAQKTPAQESLDARKDIESTGEFAPLFVKVGKYRETLETLDDLENYLRAMSRLLGLIEELEKVRLMNVSALNKMHNKALETTIKLSSGLLKPRGMSIEGTRESEIELNKLGDVISDLSKELTILKKEVDKLGHI